MLSIKKNRIVRTVCLLCVSLSFAMFGQSAQAADKLQDELTLYTSFDKSIKPDNYAGAGTFFGNYQSTAGVAGKAFDNSSLRGAAFGCVGNMPGDKGTMSFWFKPDASFAKKTTRMFSTTRFALRVDAPKRAVFFMTAYTPPRLDFRWDYSTFLRTPSLTPGKWAHIVLTWDTRVASGEGPILGSGKMSSVKKIYLNGKLATRQEVAGIDKSTEGNLNLGASTPGAYDELIIWNRLLSDKEIAKLHSAPKRTARKLKALAPLAKMVIWKVYPKLVYLKYQTSLIAPGQTLKITAPVVNRMKNTQEGTLTLTMLDVWEKPQGTPKRFAFKLAGKAKASFVASFTPAGTGAYKIQAAVTIGEETTTRDITSFGCVPAGNPPFHPFFGSHVNQTPGMPEMARRLGVSANRSHNMTQFTWWRRMQQHRDKWNMSDGHFYPAINKLGMEHMGQWFAAPYWAVTDAKGKAVKQRAMNSYPRGWMPTDLEAYKTYIRETLKRYPLIKEWEIWNEPWSTFFFAGSVEDYVKLCKISYETAKAVRPDLDIWACYADNAWGDAILKAGVLKYCDGLTFHPYTGPGDWDRMRLTVQGIRKAIKKSSGRDDVRLLNSESGVSGTTFLRGLDFPALQPPHKRRPMAFRSTANSAVQYYVTSMADGVKRWYYYFHQPVGPSNSYSSWSSVEVTRGPKPFAVALGMLAWQIDGGKFASELARDGEFHAFIFARKDGGSVAVAWTGDAAEIDLQYAGKVYNMMGNEIAHSGSIRVTTELVYLRSKLGAKALAAQLAKGPIKIVKKPVKKVVKVVAGRVLQKMDDYTVALEMGPDKMHPLDISPFINMGLADDGACNGKGGAMDEGPFNDLRDVKPGVHTWLGVPVKILDPENNGGKSIVTMAGMTFRNGPSKIGPVAVGRKARGIFFVHAANYAQRRGQQAGAYIVEYADGTKLELPIVVGENIHDWWQDRKEGEDSRTIPIVCSQPISKPNGYRFIRMWWWQNPKPHMAIKSVYLTSKKGVATIVLLGITVVDSL